MKKSQKEAVERIERWRLRTLQLRELRMIRKLLAKYPFECRVTYFKFLEVKKRTNMLITEFVDFLYDSKGEEEGI